MDSMEDSGIESDPKPLQDNTEDSKTENHVGNKADVLNIVNKKTDLQCKLEKQRDQTRRTQGEPIFMQPKRTPFLSRNKLAVPEKHGRSHLRGNPEESEHLLVHIPTDDSEDEFELPLSMTTNREITEQLIKDGYNLDLAPDDEDLDLIPPRPINDQCACCQVQSSCSIQ